MSNRTIYRVIPAQKVNMGGILIDQPLPTYDVKQIDPFLLVHHLEKTFPGGQQQQETGVPPHPHRGFVPVTFVFQGGVHHRDSLGTSSVVGPGGTQWMHAGKGIVHSERPTAEVVEEGKVWELIQFWINLPTQEKLTEPRYIPLQAEDTPTISSDDDKVKIGIVSGVFGGKEGGIKAASPLLILRMDLKKGGKTTIPIPADYNAFIYQLDGQLKINGERATKAKDMTWFSNDGEHVSIEATEDTRLILLSGQPLAEPLATYGPFVMNNDDELSEAIQDFRSGKMGQLEEQFDKGI